MNVMIAGGSGFLGRALASSLIADGHQVFVLSRSSVAPAGAHAILWDARTTRGWGHLVEEMDVIIHLAGRSLSSFPWTASVKRDFHDSRILPGLAITEAIRLAKRRPALFLQASGINHYGLRGDMADESTLPGDDFLSRLTVDWEASTLPVEEMGLRRVVLRTAVVLDASAGLLPLMALPVRLFIGGPIGDGKFALPWIHLQDWVGAVRHLMADENARGAYNLIAPTPASNADFNRALARVLHRPYWFPTPAFLLKALLGGMSVLVVEGRFARPKRLLESGFQFRHPDIQNALSDLLVKITNRGKP